MDLLRLLECLPDDILWRDITTLDSSLNVTGITLDSRQVKPGFLFIALIGEHTDGHDYISSAIKRGAIAVIGSKNIEKINVPYILIKETRYALAYLSAAFYSYPAREMTVLGVTGTDGKTTTCTLIYEILRAANLNVGVITSVNAMFDGGMVDTGFHVTTPEAPDIQRYLALMRKNKTKPVSHVVIESTSHGLSQHRVSACDFDIGVITNVTHEHLDYHKSYDAYLEAKAYLFKLLSLTPVKQQREVRLAVLNRDDASYEYLSTYIASLSPAVHQITYGFHEQADFRAVNVDHNNYMLHFDIVKGNLSIPIATKLVGDYNVYNCLAATAATMVGLQIDRGYIQKGILNTLPVPGRMQKIEMGQDFLAIVDFAHTPNALKNALETVRLLCSGKIIAVFGSAGLRDKDKRKMMAMVSDHLADISILTAEDPRTESIHEILQEMAEGIQSNRAKEGKTYWKIPDRREALRFAVGLAKKNDCVIAFGKGHEQSMCFGVIEYPWDDRIALKAAIAEIMDIKDPKMPFLPNV